ncbi:uncharacterized protein LOC131007276 [Salvia miltiorrhiza]|uniref:uncharacterized protein LOC131007276 n=1 Tax=Salvia miltiorrhiza TaxID=226208 RepID=UPI0025AD915E|nr:uncharacterized protein LOC131007276 [Salvia miltiorrhiza]
MDDSCAVCAESLEWVAYGACGHKDVCSTCVARLRFICNDRCCCICKTENDVVFVTKALGDYTKTISDFTLFPPERREGKMGQYWYHDDTQAFFDDSDHYKMIKAMCRLSCSECDKEDLPDDGSRRRAKFRNIDQLKGHLFHKHKLIMCSLCLEGRKVFICEQKLYTRAQLSQHINTGDSEVDGTESERGGFSGHPPCGFCQTPFYGDNELYTHMETEHYTCHICRRQHPGEHEYYGNYDNLEIHFRQDHFLCEDDSCLAKKFIVFASESEIKRHNAMEHGGRMSRSQRSAALQIPTSFRYRRSVEQENRRGRARTFRRDLADELSLAIQASLETASAAPPNNRARNDHGESADVDSLISPLESIGTTDPELPSRYRQAVSQSSMSGTLGDSAFPPLAAGPGGSQQSSQTDALSNRTMAAHLRHQSKKQASSSSSAPAWPAASRTPVLPVKSRQTKKQVSSSSSGPAWAAGSRTPVQPVVASHAWPPVTAVSGSASSSGQGRAVPEIGSVSSSQSTSAQIHPPSAATTSFAGSLLSSRASGSSNRLGHSSSAPSLSDRESFDSSTDFPPVSVVAQSRKSTTDDQSVRKAGNVHTANKTLVEKMRAALGSDKDKFTAFKDISGQYRLGSMDVETYLTYVDHFGLSHLVLELAGLLPNPQKQKELTDAYNLHMASRENGWNNGSRDSNSGSKKGKGKGKGKSVDTGNSSSAKNNLADNVISTVRALQSSYNAPEEEVEVLSKDGYRSARGKPVVKVGGTESSGPKTQMESSSNGGGKGKQRKKTSKFIRARLGDGSVEALLDLKNSDQDPDSDDGEPSSNGLDANVPVRGVWRNGGGQKLLSTKLGVKK